MVTPLSSAMDLTRLRPMIVLRAPSSSDMPSRLPEKVMTLGTLALAARGMYLRKPASMSAWFSMRLRAFLNFAAMGVTHGADQAVAAGDFVLFGLEEIDAFEADLCGVGAEVVEGDFLIAPAGDGLVDVVAAWGGSGGCCLCGCERVASEKRGCAGDTGLQDVTTGK